MTEKERGITIGPDIDGDFAIVDGKEVYFNLSKGDSIPEGIDVEHYVTDADGDTAYPKGIRVAIIGGAGIGRSAAMMAKLISEQGVSLVPITPDGTVDVLAHVGEKITVEYQALGGRIKDELELMYPNMVEVIPVRRMHEVNPRKFVNNYPTPRVNKKQMHKRR